MHVCGPPGAAAPTVQPVHFSFNSELRIARGAGERAAEGVGPYGLNEMRAYRRGVEDAVPYGLSGTFLIQFRIPNSEFRTVQHRREAKRKHSPVGLCFLVWMRTK